MSDPIKEKYYEATTLACELMCKALLANQAGDMETWCDLVREATAIQRKALDDYNLANAVDATRR